MTTTWTPIPNIHILGDQAALFTGALHDEYGPPPSLINLAAQEFIVVMVIINKAVIFMSKFLKVHILFIDKHIGSLPLIKSYECIDKYIPYHKYH